MTLKRKNARFSQITGKKGGIQFLNWGIVFSFLKMATRYMQNKNAYTALTYDPIVCQGFEKQKGSTQLNLSHLTTNRRSI